MPTIYLNGKFTAQPTTGVQRVAQCMVSALDRAVVPASPWRWVLLCPPGGDPPQLQRIEIETVGSRRAGLHAWEQICLPWAARAGLLLSLAGSAPAFARRQACTFHDAAVFDHPEFYTRRFRLWYRWLFRRLGRHALGLITVSEFSRRRLAAALGIEAGRIEVIGNGADHLARVTADGGFLATAGLAGKRFFLAVGSDSANKNVGAVVAAFARLPAADDLWLVLVGGGRGTVFAASGADAMAAPTARVLRLGPVADGALKALYEAALGLVFPSHYEGFGLPPVEAMACGCPVVVSSAGALPEVCGDATLQVHAQSPGEIATAMARLAGEPALRANLIGRGRARVALYNWDASARHLHAILERLIVTGTATACAARAAP